MNEQISRQDQFYLALSAALFIAVACWWIWGWNSERNDADRQRQLAAQMRSADADNDGVADLQDDCPTLAGALGNRGCPADDDADGIANLEDRCPSIAGVAAMLGCPQDSDGDSISDHLDLCPGLAGDASDDGCPADSDGDGVFDIDDNCPQQAGYDGYGCAASDQPSSAAALGADRADADGDGIADAQDQCPAHPGPPSAAGCPLDSDADGVVDALDQCPDTAGAINGNGCPVAADSDMDGIADDSDDCPAVAGIIARHGCPADRDSDGVADGDDLCPNTAGATNLRGCPPRPEDMIASPVQRGATIELPASLPRPGEAPEVKTYPAAAGAAPAGAATGAAPAAPISAADQNILDSALAMLEFEPDSAKLAGNSANALMNVAKLLKRYPDAILEIAGHTDSSGDAAKNMALSQERARTCALFFVQHGIGAARLRAAGFGESRPIASNATPEGRRLNRRVEFKLVFGG